MNLSEFSSYFELLAGINFGYAIFDFFRKNLSSGVFNINKGTSNDLDFLKDRLKIQISEKKENNPDFSKALYKIHEGVKVSSESLEHTEAKERFFIEILKPVSYLSGFFCLVILLFSGFIENTDDILVKEILLFVICIYGTFSMIFSFITFYGTFSNRILKNKQVFSVYQVTLLVFLFLTFSFFHVSYLIKSVSYGWQIIFVLFFPLILFLGLSEFMISKVTRYSEKDKRVTIEDILKTPLHIAKFSFIILTISLILIVYTEAVDLNLIKSDFYKYYMYFTILIVPVQLFVFMPIRIFIHKRKYRRKYRNLYKGETKKLNDILVALEQPKKSS